MMSNQSRGPWGRDIRKGVGLSLTSCCILMAVQGAALAEGGLRIGVLEENDSLYTDSDRHYTQGLRLSALGGELAPLGWGNRPFDLVGGLVPIFSPGGAATSQSRRYAVFLGQSLFTPENKARKPPDPGDRPYGAWLHLGVSLLQETGGTMLENLEMAVGTVGPGALGKLSQNDFHQFIGASPSRGWGQEIHNEPGAVLSYERLWRIGLLGEHGDGVEVIPQLGATLGNIFTYGSAGALLRVGKNLQADYGGGRIRPALSGTDYFNAAHLDGKLGYNIFAGVQGRAVGRNIFLDGSAFHRDPSVEKKNFVMDLQAGFSLFWSEDIQMTFSAVRRTREYQGQPSPDVIGTASIAFSL
jgi:lipid A 3-O-deacylase